VSACLLLKKKKENGMNSGWQADWSAVIHSLAAMMSSMG